MCCIVLHYNITLHYITSRYLYRITLHDSYVAPRGYTTAQLKFDLKMDGDSILLWNLGCTMVLGDVVRLKPPEFNANKRIQKLWTYLAQKHVCRFTFRWTWCEDEFWMVWISNNCFSNPSLGIFRFSDSTGLQLHSIHYQSQAANAFTTLVGKDSRQSLLVTTHLMSIPRNLKV